MTKSLKNVRNDDKIEEEPTTSLPDLSDPGRMMGPEDIASLIANM